MQASRSVPDIAAFCIGSLASCVSLALGAIAQSRAGAPVSVKLSVPNSMVSITRIRLIASVCLCAWPGGACRLMHYGRGRRTLYATVVFTIAPHFSFAPPARRASAACHQQRTGGRGEWRATPGSYPRLGHGAWGIGARQAKHRPIAPLRPLRRLGVEDVTAKYGVVIVPRFVLRCAAVHAARAVLVPQVVGVLCIMPRRRGYGGGQVGNLRNQSMAIVAGDRRGGHCM